MIKLNLISIFWIIIFFEGNICMGRHELKQDSIRSVLDAMPEDTLKVDKLLNIAANTTWSDIRSAEAYARQALQISEKLNYTKGLAYSNYRLALIFKDSDFKITEELILESLDQAVKINDSILIGRIYNTIGNMKDNVNEGDGALQYYNMALQVFDDIGKDSLKAKVYNNLGIIYDNKNEFDTAVQFYLKASRINKNLKNYLGLAINYLNLGYCYLISEKLEDGYSYLQKSLELSEDYNIKRLRPYIFNNFSDYYLRKKDYQEAIRLANKGLESAKEQINRLQERNALILLKDIYVESNDIKNAFEISEEINKVNDSITKYNKLKEIDLMEMKFAYEQQRKQQQYQSELLKTEIKKKELTLILIIGSAGLVIVVFVFLYILQVNRIRQKTLVQKATLLEKEKLAQQLEFKNKELTTNVMYLVKKNEFINNISKKLKNTELDDNNKNNEIARIISEIDRAISEENWSDFEMRFQEVHVDFYNKLSKKFPDLTPNELRLCAFLRLNMTSKEIANLTYQSVDSLKTARYRLRKKLGIGREENLVTFLTRI